VRTTKRQLRKLVREISSEEEARAAISAVDSHKGISKADTDLANYRQAQQDKAAGKKMATDAAEGMVKSKSGRQKLATMIEKGGDLPEKTKQWLIDSICGVAQTRQDDSDNMGAIAKKICRIVGNAAGGGTWIQSKIAGLAAEMLRGMSDEDAAALIAFGKEMMKPEDTTQTQIKTESRKMKITKRQLRRIIKEAYRKLLRESEQYIYRTKSGELRRSDDDGNDEPYPQGERQYSHLRPGEGETVFGGGRGGYGRRRW